MLFLIRKVGESVDISRAGQPLVTVKVMGFLPNDQVRLGFDADRSVTIMRDNAINRRYNDEPNDKEEGDEGEGEGANGNR
jgi:carbon storage regulator CsrA